MTSSTYNGNLGGLAGADALCQDHADAASLDGTYSAFMVDQSQGLERLEHPAVPFVRLDGVVIANDWADLSDESLAAPLNIDELEHAVAGVVWTGLPNVGGAFDNTCESWTFEQTGCLVGEVCGAAGESDMIDDHWDGYFVFNCNSSHRLYCIEQ